MLIYQSRNFKVEAPELPLVDRADGGHIVIDPLIRVVDRQQLTPLQAIELARLTMVTGEAMTSVLIRHGVDIGRINYQDNGNWGVFKPEGPFMHMHLYGRAKSARVQRYGQACYFPHRDENPKFYEKFNPLTAEDVLEIKKEIIALLREKKYTDTQWGLSNTDRP